MKYRGKEISTEAAIVILDYIKEKLEDRQERLDDFFRLKPKRMEEWYKDFNLKPIFDEMLNDFEETTPEFNLYIANYFADFKYMEKTKTQKCSVDFFKIGMNEEQSYFSKESKEWFLERNLNGFNDCIKEYGIQFIIDVFEIDETTETDPYKLLSTQLDIDIMMKFFISHIEVNEENIIEQIEEDKFEWFSQIPKKFRSNEKIIYSYMENTLRGCYKNIIWFFEKELIEELKKKNYSIFNNKEIASYFIKYTFTKKDSQKIFTKLKDIPDNIMSALIEEMINDYEKEYDFQIVTYNLSTLMKSAKFKKSFNSYIKSLNKDKLNMLKNSLKKFEEKSFVSKRREIKEAIKIIEGIK